MNPIITVGGMVSTGKTSIAKLLGKAFQIPVYQEPVDNNPVLERFYTASQKESEEERLPFLLQLYFLGMRFRTIKENIHTKSGIIDRSIYEDVYFAVRNAEFGKKIGEKRITDLELQIYRQLFDEMMKETEEYAEVYGTKTPDVMIYLRSSFETVMHRIGMRGRDFEQGADLINYYYFLWEGYDDWVYNHYNASEVLTLDMDRLDVVNNWEDAQEVVSTVKQFLIERGYNYYLKEA